MMTWPVLGHCVSKYLEALISGGGVVEVPTRQICHERALITVRNRTVRDEVYVRLPSRSLLASC